MIREQSSCEENDDYVSYNVASLCTNVPIHDTIKYILEENFQSQFCKQAGGCTMGGPLSVTLSNKLEKDQVKPLKPKFFSLVRGWRDK